MPKIHTQGFREQAVQKVFARKGKSIKTIAQELGIGYSTLQQWMRDYQSMTPTLDNNNQRPHDWSPKQRFQALMDTAAMDAEHASQYCRENGIFPHHLGTWRDNFIGNDKKSTGSVKADASKLRKENAVLQKELRRKEKALAEAAALLILQKKFHALLEGEGE